MASDKKDTTPSTAPSSATRARASEITARRGRLRDALAVISNVEAMLRSSHASIDDELGELRNALEGLHDALAAAPAELRRFAASRIGVIEAAASARSADAMGRAAAELETTAGLVELIDRANDGGSLEVSCATLAEQALQLAWSVRSRGAFPVRVRAAVADCSVACDPHVVAQMLAMAISTVRETTPDVVVRTHVEDDAGIIEITGATADDANARVMQARPVVRIPESDALLAAAATAAGIGLHVEPGRILLRCPRVDS
ncbi:MAG TPA: hypothetical protein VH054_19780 [Polyangiaceae bacterium]|nr:hypothetical protein [Polyangiaceae bacterium]